MELLHDRSGITTGIRNEVAAQEQPIPPEILLDLARSLFLEYHRLLQSKEERIAQLETALRLAAACWRPSDAVLQ